INQLSAAIPELGAWLSTLVIDWDKLANAALSFLQNDMGNLLGSTVGVVASVFSGIFHGAMGFVFAVYLLLQKETLCRQCRKFVYAFFPMRWADSAVRVCLLSNRVFSSFLSGQCAEAVILGSMFFLAMSVTGFPYALMIGVLVGFTALIPIFGAFIGCGIGAFLIVMVSPVRAFWFIMLFLILQQLEGNFIYPKVVGGSVGLPSMWVLLAVTIGGSAMGIIGMLVFIPLVSVLYALLREAVNQRLAARALPADKLVPDAQQQAGGNQG
ncbi:MAG: AI-2E family transporter, partial [Oscillospiraceae bacterium]